MLRGLVFVLCAGCLDEPRFRGGPRDAAVDASPDATVHGVELVADESVMATPNLTNNTVVAEGPFYSMTFSNMGGRYPFQLNVEDSNGNAGILFATPTNTELCFNEKGTGVGLFPMGAVHGEGGGVGSPTVMPSLRGNAVAQATISWTQSYCTGDVLTIAASSIFTFFPDGRVHRFDELVRTAIGTVNASSSMCSCLTPQSNFVLTTYMTLNNSQVSSFEHPGGQVMPPIAENENRVMGANRLCANMTGGTRRIAFGFETLSSFPRLRRLPNVENANAISVVKDFFNFAAPPTEFTGQATLNMATTHLLSNSQTCGALMSRIDAITNGGQIIATHGGSSTALAIERRTGIYASNATINAQVVTLRAQTAQTVPGGFAVTLHFDSRRTFRVYRNGATDNRGTVQTVTPGETDVIIWLREGLSGDQTIVVVAEPQT